MELSNFMEVDHGGIVATSPNNFSHTFNVRPKDGEKLLKAIEMFEEVLIKQGWEPSKQSAVGSEQSGRSRANALTQSFAAETLSVTIDDGKVYYKVKGGEFSKFGVFIWPEALAASGIEVDDIDPIKGLNLRGWTAEYTLNDDGNPKKVTHLYR